MSSLDTGWVGLGSARHTDFRGSMRISENLTVGAGANGVVKVRHVDGKHFQNDNDDPLFLNWNTGHDVHVGGAKRAGLVVTGDLTVGAGANGRVHVRHVDGKHFQNDNDDGLFLNWNTGHPVQVGGAKRATLHVTSDLVVEGGNGNPIPGFPSWSGGGIRTWDVFAGGTIQCPNKHFAIDHPADAGRRLVHASLEGPESAVYYRGEAALHDGEATIELPGYFEALTRAESRTVLATPRFERDEPVSALAVSEIEDGAFRVRGIGDANPAQRFYWEVKAVRADVDPLDVEPPKRIRDAVPA